MWLILFVAVGSAAIALVRGPRMRPVVLLAGCIGTLIAGMAGMATGLWAVSAKYVLFPDKVEAIAAGLGELANNGVFAAVLAWLLGMAAYATHRKVAAA
jgi:hypothetical protein